MLQAPRFNGSMRLRLATRALLAVALVASLALAGCGRKGGLDPPPMAAAGDVQSPPPGATAAPGPDGRPVQPPAQTPPVTKQKTFLDWLID